MSERNPRSDVVTPDARRNAPIEDTRLQHNLVEHRTDSAIVESVELKQRLGHP